MHHYETLIFDFGNVLIDIDIPKWEKNIRSIIDDKLNEADLEPLLIDHFHKMEKGQLSNEDFVDGMLPYVKPGICRDNIIQSWNSILIGMTEDRFEMLLKLREKYKIYLLSNTNAMHMEWVYNYLRDTFQIEDWDDRYFDQTFYSHKMGMRKPDLDIYNEIVRVTGLDPEMTLFFDDNVDNIQAAKKFNIHGYLKPPSRDIGSIIQHLGLL